MSSDLQKHEPALLELLEELLNFPALEPRETLTATASSVARWLHCDKVDAFIFDETRGSLVALGTSDTEMGRLQRALGLDVLPVANGGRLIEVYRTGEPFVVDHAERDQQILPGIVEKLGVRSALAVPLEVAGTRRGVFTAVTREPGRFDVDDLRALKLVARWTGALVQRIELVQQLREQEAERGRRVAAEEIMTVLSHDVRNHLSPLTARLQLMQMKLRKGSTLDSAELDAALAAVRRLANLTHELLDVARLEQGLFRLDLGSVDLMQVLREAVDMLASGKNRVELEGPESLILIGDGPRLRQAFENVIANGVRHSPAGHPLRVSVHCEQEPPQAVIEVADRGKGIAPEIMPHIFERFVSSPGSRGIGLGLFLARRIAQAHQGDLTVDSQLGQGARFRFQLPLELAAA